MRLGFGTTALLVAVILALPVVTIAAEHQMNVKTLVQDNSAFATDLYQKLCMTNGNIFFSPYSISSALAMTYAGARGKTEEQMARALRFSLEQKDLNPVFAVLESRVNRLQETGNVRLSVANSLWPQKDYEFLPEYLELTKKYYGVSIIPLDYNQASEAARVINNWVANKTQDKIKDIISPRNLNALTRVVLANAIYFKGNWEKRFDAIMTKDTPFFLSPGKSVQTPMMTLTGKFRYAGLESLQILELPYGGNELSMLVMLPKETDGIKLLERNLSKENLMQWRDQMKPTRVLVYFPKFEITSTFGLGDTLVSMGMVDAFSMKEANFSGMATVNPSEPLYLSAVFHKAFVEVGEEGTEAAAATAVTMKVGSARTKPQEPPPTFRADHPFIFLIQENQTGSILFMGRVATPTIAVKRDTQSGFPKSRPQPKPKGTR